MASRGSSCPVRLALTMLWGRIGSANSRRGVVWRWPLLPAACFGRSAAPPSLPFGDFFALSCAFFSAPFGDFFAAAVGDFFAVACDFFAAVFGDFFAPAFLAVALTDPSCAYVKRLP